MELTNKRSSFRRLLDPAILVLAAGLAYVFFLQSQIQEPVFYSGDAGMKLLMTRQFAAGRWATDLALPGPAWVQEAWASGAYPFHKPFVHLIDGRIVPSFPFAFPALTAPFCALFGWRGLYVLPVASLLPIWAWGWLVCRRLEFTTLERTLSVATLVFGSFATAYSATFWEHLPAVALASWGLYPLLIAFRSPPTLKASALGGLLLGLAAWLRPECICLAGAAVLAWAVPSIRQRQVRPLLAFTAGAAAGILSFVAVNMVLYGYPLGVHSLDVVQDRPWVDRVAGEMPRIAAELAMLLLAFCPLAIWLILAALRTRLRGLGRLESSRLLAIIAVISVIFFAGVVVISPNSGGFQWGPRYLMPLVPFAALAVGLSLAALRLAGRSTERSTALVVLCLLLAYSAWENTWVSAESLHGNYSYRIAPTMQYLQQHSSMPVVSQDQYVAQELAWQLEYQPFFTVPRGPDAADRLIDLIARMRRAGQTRFIFIQTSYGTERIAMTPMQLAGPDFDVELRPVAQTGPHYYVFAAIIRP